MQRLSAFAKGHWHLLALTLCIFALWQTSVMLPLKILIVFFHEAAHALAAIATGGEVISIEVNARQGGVMWSRGGNRFFVATAGYLGSLMIGVALFVAALKSAADRVILFGLGLCLTVLAALYIRDAFSLLFVLAVASVTFLIAVFLPRAVSDLTLRVIGLASMVYVPWDIVSDTVLPRGARLPGSMSDAARIAEQVGGTEGVWGVVWIIIGTLVIATTLKLSLRQPSNLHISDFSRSQSS